MRKRKNKIVNKVVLCPHCKTENKLRVHVNFYKIRDVEFKREWAICPACHQLFDKEEQKLWY